MTRTLETLQLYPFLSFTPLAWGMRASSVDLSNVSEAILRRQSQLGESLTNTQKVNNPALNREIRRLSHLIRGGSSLRRGGSQKATGHCAVVELEGGLEVEAEGHVEDLELARQLARKRNMQMNRRRVKRREQTPSSVVDEKKETVCCSGVH